MTPSGRFEASLIEYPGYGGEMVSFYGAQDYQIAIHKLYLDEPAERRAQRLASDSPADNRISWGCINVAEDTFFDFIRFAFEEGGVVYVLPETEQGRSVFPPLGGRATTPQFNIPSSGIMPSIRPLQGDQQRNETSARRRRGKAQVPASLRDRDGPPLPNIKVSANDGARAREIEDKQVPGAKDTWIGTAAEYLAEFPDQTAVNDRRVEAFYDPATDRAVILIDRVVARDGDAIRAARNGTSAALEAVRRLIRHESFVHRGWRALPENLKREFLSIAENVVPADDLDQLAKVYKRFANWRNDPALRALAVEEWLAQRLERIEKLPAGSDSVLNQLVDWAKRVWQWLAGDDSVEPTRAELVELMRQMVRALETGEKERATSEIRASLATREKVVLKKLKRHIQHHSGKIQVGETTDNLPTVASSNGKDAGSEQGIVKADLITGYIDLSQPTERDRVDRLKEKMLSEDGFISPIVISAQGEIIEGQHRFAALSELGATDVPVVVLYEASDFIQDPDAVVQRIQDTGLRPEQARTMLSRIAEILREEKGSVQALTEYGISGQFADAFNAGVKEVQRQGSPDIRFSLTGNEAEIEQIIREDRDDAESGVVPTRARPLAPGASPTSATEQLGPRTVNGKKIDGQEIIERNRIQQTSMERTKSRAIEIVDKLGPMDQWTSTLLNPAWQERAGLSLFSTLGQFVVAEAFNRVSIVSKTDRLRYSTLNDLLARQWQTGGTPNATAQAARSSVTSDPRYAALFAVQAMIDEQRKQQAGIIDPALGSTEATVEATRNADTEAQQQATEDVDSELRLKDALYELGLAGQNPETQQRIRRVNDNVFRLGVLARLREQMRARAEQASFVSLSASAVEAEYAAMTVEQLDAEVARLEKELQDDLAALETERRKVRTTKSTGTAKTVVEQAKDLIAKLEAAPGVKKTPKPNPVRDLYKAHLKQPMAEGDFIKALTDMGVELEDAQKLYELAAVKIAAAEAVAAQKQAEREAARQAREADKPTPAEAFATRTINEVANRLADPENPQFEPSENVRKNKKDTLQALYKKHVRSGIEKEEFIRKAVSLGADPVTASTLHGVGTLERDSNEIRKFYIRTENDALAAQKFAEGIVEEASERFADPPLPQKPLPPKERKKKKETIKALYAAHVKKPMGRDAFVEAARKLGVDERTAATMHGVGTMENEARAIQKDARKPEQQAKRILANLADPEKMVIETMLNKIRSKLTGDLNWREIFDRPLTNQREWRQQMFDRLMSDPAVSNLTPQEVRDLAAELDRIWNAKREAAFKALAKRMNLPGAREGVKEKIAESAPALIRYINSGAFNDVNFRNAIADKFGVPQLDEARVDEVIALVQKAQEAKTQVERNKYMNQAIRLMQEGMKAELGEVISNYWVTSVLSGFATLFDMAMSVLNGARVMTQFSADAIIRQRDFKLAGRAAKNYFQSLGNAILESTYYFVSGDPSMLDNYQFTLNTYLREGSAAANPFDYFERIIKDPSKPSWAKIVPYYFAGLQRLMTAFDHINSTSTAQGTLEHALAYNRKLFGDARMPSQQDVAAARAKAVQLAGGDRTFAQKRKVTAYTRQILNEEFNKTYPGILDEAKDIGRIAAYQNDPTGIGGIIYHTLLGLTNKAVKAAGDFRDEGRALGEAQGIVSKFMREFMYILAVNSRNISGTRFVRFVGNRVNELISFTPGAGYLRTYEKDTSPTRRAMLLQNQVVGGLLSVWVVATLLRMMDDEEDDEKRGFRISGSWQGLTPDRKNQLRANNMTPNSVQIWDGEKWVNFNYTPWPVASLLATVGNLADMKKYHPERWGAKEPLDRILAAAWAGAFSFKDLSAISGFMDMFGASAYSGDPVDSAVKWLGKFSSNYVGGVVPRMLKDIDLIMDPKARKPTDISEHFAKELPFYRRTEAGGERMYNIFGEQVELNRLPWRRVVTATRPEREYQILAELNNRGLFLGVANADNRTVGMGASRRELTDEEAERYAVETGKRYRQFVLDQGERLLEMPEEQAKLFLSRRTEALRNAALRDAIRTQP
jgi:hypothetical protein